MEEEEREVPKQPPTREEFIKKIANGTIFGNLGLFIGAGLPMAIFNNKKGNVALSWRELIEKCSAEFDIPLRRLKRKGNAYPQIATQLCKIIAKNENKSYKNAVKLLKEKISNLTSLYPDRRQRQKYIKYFDSLSPNWIITTNYDTVIESILTGKGAPISPEDQMVVQKGYIPVYHLHGIRTIPDTIIITQEDYVSLFRPNQYRLQKLPLTIKESTTLLIGYSLGDFNVLTALDWSRNVFVNGTTSYPNDILQLVQKKERPKITPYYDNGVLILEFSDLSEVLDEICEVVLDKKDEYDSSQKSLKRLEKKYLNPSAQIVRQFVEDHKLRKRVLKKLTVNNNSFINGFLELLSKATDLSWERARTDGAFWAYDENLVLVLDILENLEIKTTPPALIEMLVSNLNLLTRYIGMDTGQSFAASRTWQRRKKKISEKIINEIRNISSLRGYTSLLELLGTIPN